MTLYYQDDMVTIHHGDCINVMQSLPAASIDAIVTDPPYGVGFMGKAWDDLPPGLDFAIEALRVLKPGGHMLAFGGTRTWHRLAVAVEDAGFEIRDSIAWLYGSGFPKNGGVLKPAFEPILVARKAFKGTLVKNVAETGVGALNIEANRTPTSDNLNGGAYSVGAKTRGDMWTNQRVGDANAMRNGAAGEYSAPAGRHPTNVLLDRSQTDSLDAQRADVSRYFPTFKYEPKAPKAERPIVGGVQHPTVKPLSLMRWLVKLVTPEGGTILDPFAGSGTTIEAALIERFKIIGIERESEYLPLVRARIEREGNAL